MKHRALNILVVSGLFIFFPSPSPAATKEKLMSLSGFKNLVLTIAMVNKAMRDAAENPMDAWRRQNVAHAVGLMPEAIRGLAQEFKSGKLHDADLAPVQAMLGGFINVNAADAYKKFATNPDKRLIPQVGNNFPMHLETAGAGAGAGAASAAITYNENANKNAEPKDVLNDAANNQLVNLGGLGLDLDKLRGMGPQSGSSKSDGLTYDETAKKGDDVSKVAPPTTSNLTGSSAVEGEGSSNGATAAVSAAIAENENLDRVPSSIKGASGGLTIQKKKIKNPTSLDDEDKFFENSAKKKAAAKKKINPQNYRVPVKPKYWMPVRWSWLPVKSAQASENRDPFAEAPPEQRIAAQRAVGQVLDANPRSKQAMQKAFERAASENGLLTDDPKQNELTLKKLIQAAGQESQRRQAEEAEQGAGAGGGAGGGGGGPAGGGGGGPSGLTAALFGAAAVTAAATPAIVSAIQSSAAQNIAETYSQSQQKVALTEAAGLMGDSDNRTEVALNNAYIARDINGMNLQGAADRDARIAQNAREERRANIAQKSADRENQFTLERGKLGLAQYQAAAQKGLTDLQMAVASRAWLFNLGGTTSGSGLSVSQRAGVNPLGSTLLSVLNRTRTSSGGLWSRGPASFPALRRSPAQLLSQATQPIPTALGVTRSRSTNRSLNSLPNGLARGSTRQIRYRAVTRVAAVSVRAVSPDDGSYARRSRDSFSRGRDAVPAHNAYQASDSGSVD